MRGVPLQVSPAFVYDGVIVIVAVTGAVPLLIAVKAGMLPAPLAARPMAVFEFVHVNTVPGTVPVGVTAVVIVLWHSAWSEMAATFGVGLTVIVKVVGVPEQISVPLVKRGVTVMVDVTGVVPLLTAVKAAMLPEPLAASPMLVLLLVHANVAPGTLPENVIAVVCVPAQRTWLATAFTVGVGLTVIVNVRTVPVQVTPAFVYEGVTVMVAMIGAVVRFTALKAGIVPVPLAARPMAVFEFVHV